MPRSMDQITDLERNHICRESRRYFPDPWSLRLLLRKNNRNYILPGVKMIFLIVYKINMKSNEIYIILNNVNI